MLKMIKIEKNTVIYRSMPFLVFILKWIDNKILGILKLLEINLKRFGSWYVHKVSTKIDSLYSKKSITKIKPKYKAKKKGK